MKITNVHKVPEPLMTLAKGQYYSKGEADYSVTELMSPPRVQRLKSKHNADMVQDVSQMLWSLLGSALHVVMERGQTEGWITEERLFTKVDRLKHSKEHFLCKKVGALWQVALLFIPLTYENVYFIIN